MAFYFAGGDLIFKAGCLDTISPFCVFLEICRYLFFLKASESAGFPVDPPLSVAPVMLFLFLDSWRRTYFPLTIEVFFLFLPVSASWAGV